MTIEEARKMREQAESDVLQILQRLQLLTGMDIAGMVPVMLVDATNDEPVRRVTAVRIDLAV